MIVGVAGLIVGAIIGGTPGTIIMVAGGAARAQGIVRLSAVTIVWRVAPSV